MNNKIYVVYAKAATGLKEWPIAAFFNHEGALQHAQEFAECAVREGKSFRTGSGTHVVAKTSIRDFSGWGKVPSLSKGF